MRRLALAVALGLAGCDGASPVDAGVGDAGFVPAAPSPPVLTPCPEGWREVTSATGVVTCDPWPEGGYRGGGCAWDEAHLAGAPDCARIGTACPADGWPADLPSDRPIVYVDDDAAPGGDGASRGTALATILDATALAPEGAVIAVATGRYDEAVRIFAGMTIWGACVSGTRIVTSARSETEAALTLAEEGAGATNLGIDGAARLGIVAEVSGVRLDAIVIAGARVSGLFVGRGSLMATGLVIRGTRGRPSDGLLGRGINVQEGGHLALSRALVDDNLDSGLLVVGAGTSVEVDDLVVRGTRGRASDRTLGRGIDVGSGAHLVISRALVEDNRETGLLVNGAGTSVEAVDVVVRGTRERSSDDTGGRAIDVADGAHLAVSRALLEDNREVGFFVHGSRVEAEDLVVRGTRERSSDGGSGRGIDLELGAELTLARALVEDNREIGLFVNGAGASVEASDLIVRGTLRRASDDSFGTGLWAQLGARVVVTGARIEGSHSVGIASVTAASVEVREVAVIGVEPSRCPPRVCTGDSGGFGLAAMSGGALDATGFIVEGATLCGVVVGAHDLVEGPSALDLHRGVIDRSPIGACVQVAAYDNARLRQDVEYRDVDVPLQATSYELPEMLP